jgi:hypothetical protein
VAVGLHREQRARLDRPAVEVDGARPALAGVAPDVRAGEAGDVPQIVDEQEPRLDLVLARHAVDDDSDLLGHALLQHIAPDVRDAMTTPHLLRRHASPTADHTRPEASGVYTNSATQYISRWAS